MVVVMGYNAIQLLNIQPTFRRTLCLPPDFTPVSCSSYSSTLKMVTSSSETSGGFQRTTRRYIPIRQNSSVVIVAGACLGSLTQEWPPLLAPLFCLFMSNVTMYSYIKLYGAECFMGNQQSLGLSRLFRLFKVSYTSPTSNCNPEHMKPLHTLKPYIF